MALETHKAPLTVRWIVNADDFGLTEGINRAVIELHQAGALSSATLMANGDAFDDAVQIARASPSLGIGCHIVLVDGAPISRSPKIRSLLGADGHLRSSLAGFAVDLYRGRVSEEALTIEAMAQIQKLQAAGLQPTHIDTHKHTHLFPAVARAVLQAAAACGVTAVRNPFEEAWSAHLARGALVRRFEVSVLRSFRSTFFELTRQFGMSTSSGSIGVSATGTLDAPMLRNLLETAPPGTWELVCHPGYNDAALAAVRTRLRSTREVERLALLQQIPAAVEHGTIGLCSFAALTSE